MGRVTIPRFAPRTLLVVLTAAFALALAPSAGAATFPVNWNTDGADVNLGDGVCDADAVEVGDQCSLRAAIEEAEANNNDATVTDQITFPTLPIPGPGMTTGSTITILTANGPLNGAGVADGIDEKVVIDACSSVAMPTQPCVHVRGETAIDLFSIVRADDSTIKGFMLSDADRAIFVSTDSSNLTLKNNWFGLMLNGNPEANNRGVVTAGSGATIGGTVAADRNVFAGTGVALEISGDNNQVLGNYFGVEEDGTTAAANSQNIIISGTTAPSGNVIGAADVGSDPGTCDDGCNVIANATGTFPAGRAINLHNSPDTPADSTTITGNFIGFDAAGNVDASRIAIWHQNATGTTIGGATAAHRNYITASASALVAAAQGAPDLLVQNNFIGLDLTGTQVRWLGAAFGATAVSIVSDPVPDAAQFRDNRVALPPSPDGSLGLDWTGPDGQITGNTFGIGTGGEQLTIADMAMRIVSGGVNFAADNLNVSNNTIGNAANVGISAEGVKNSTFAGNFLGTTPTGGSHPIGNNGIQLFDNPSDFATGNTIGGDTAAEENVISNAANDAIFIANDGNDGNLIDRNRGSNNGGMFIDLVVDFGLVGDGPGNPLTGPNDGIQAPTITSATTSMIQGAGAEAGATVRVYSKATAADGDIEAFLGTAVAAMDGTWQLTYGATPPPAGKLVTANQTDITSNSSEMSAAATTQGPPSGSTPPPVQPTPPAVGTTPILAPPAPAKKKKCKKRKKRKKRAAGAAKKKCKKKKRKK